MRRMIRTYGAISVVGAASYAAFWTYADTLKEARFERNAVATCTVLGVVMGGFIGLAFIRAQKTRLNFAFFLLFLCITGLFALTIAPNSLGIILNGAPIETNRPPNPYALFVIPSWLRVGLFVVFNFAMLGGIVEFYKANWSGKPWHATRRHRQLTETWNGEGRQFDEENA